jgi:hypothetical protein
MQICQEDSKENQLPEPAASTERREDADHAKGRQKEEQLAEERYSTSVPNPENYQQSTCVQRVKN